MEPRISLITLGVANIHRSRSFYEAMGFEASPASADDVVFFKSSGTILALYPRDLLAKDAHVDNAGTGFRGMTLAHNVREKHEVAEILKQAEIAGGRVVKSAQDVFWGGHSGYFSDPDGHLWEVAWNPAFPMDARGEISLP